MKPLENHQVLQYVENHIRVFHEKRITSLNKLNLKNILKRKNPYLFKAKNVTSSHDIIKGIVDAHISSAEESIFGDWLEGLAIFINSQVYDGIKSGIEGIDLEFSKDDVRYIVSIKSGPNWGNSSQIKKMKSEFNKAIRTLKTSNSLLNVIAVNGCCYGIDKKPVKEGYHKYCGKVFWDFISGDPDLYIKIIQPLGHQAKIKNDEFLESYDKILNRFTSDFSQEFCGIEGNILWEKLLKLNSNPE